MPSRCGEQPAVSRGDNIIHAVIHETEFGDRGDLRHLLVQARPSVLGARNKLSQRPNFDRKPVLP